MHIPQCRHATLHARESPETSSPFTCSHAGTVLLKEVSPASSEETGREKRRKLHGTLESWAGQRWGQKRSPSASGEWVWVLETPTQNSEVGFGDRYLQSPGGGQGMLGGSSAAAALKLWKVRGEEISPKHDSSGKRDGCAFLFCFVSLFLLKGRGLLYERYFFYCGAKVAVVQAG